MYFKHVVTKNKEDFHFPIYEKWGESCEKLLMYFSQQKWIAQVHCSKNRASNIYFG